MNKKKLFSVALAASMLATSMSAFAYSDVSDGHWAKSYIDDLSGKKYVKGYEDGSYQPDALVTRAEFAKILVNIFGVIDQGNVSLADVNDSAWYAEPMKIAVKAGYITGYSDNTVKPENPITRQEAAVMVYRAWELTPEGSLNFVDKAEIADWASNQVATLVAKNVLNGYEDGTFRPNNNITRAEVAKIISSALKLERKSASTVTPSGTTGSMVHVGGTTANTTYPSSSSSSSSGGNGGGNGGGGGGGSTGTTTSTVKPGTDVNVGAAITKALNKTTVADDDTLQITFPEVKDAVKGELSVTYTKADGTKKTVTMREFEKLIFGKNDIDLGNIKISFDVDFDKTGTINLKANISINDGKKEISTSDTKIKVDQEADINYVVIALQNFQKGVGTDADLAVVFTSATKKGSEDAKVATWLEENSYKVAVLKDVVNAVMDGTDYDVAAVAKSDTTYTSYVSLFKKMDEIIAEAAKFAASKNGELTLDEALDYFNTTVSDSIDRAATSAYRDDLKAVAKAFGVKLASKLDTLNADVKAAETEDAKVSAVYAVYYK